MSTTEPVPQRPSLRIEQLAITNFRTFRERTVIPFSSAGSPPDSIATFHGDNGSGKSNAIAALDLFFKVAAGCLAHGNDDCVLLATWDRPVPVQTASGAVGTIPLVVSYRDRPAGAEGSTEIEVALTDSRLGALRVQLVPSGNQVRIQLFAVQLVGGRSLSPRDLLPGRRRALLSSFQTPFGPGSRPMAVLNPRRQSTWLENPGHSSLLHPSLAEELFALRTALRPDLRERWRQFAALLSRFPTFQGKEVSIERLQPNATPELILEERGRTVLPLGELSSGEQQIIVLCATSLLANAAILAIEEPELSLDAKNQRLLQAILNDAVGAGLMDQILLESHVPSFDGPNVIRFRREVDGTTAVTREPSASTASAELASKAEQQGATQRWVTHDGYTQLPEKMRDDLRIGPGAHVWFLKGPSRWEAWKEDELTALLADGDAEASDD